MVENIIDDYNTLMQGRRDVGVSPARYTIYDDGSDVELLSTSRYSFIFVLNGEIDFLFKMYNKIRLTAPQMMAVDKEQIESMRSNGNTIVLECETSGRMVPLIQGTSKAFNFPCSDLVPLNDELTTWCRSMLEDLVVEPLQSNDYYHKRCRTLTLLFLKYPRTQLGTLYIPLYACALQCDNCAKDFRKV